MKTACTLPECRGASVCHECAATPEVEAAFAEWQQDPGYYRWHTLEERALLNFAAGYRAAKGDPTNG